MCPSGGRSTKTLPGTTDPTLRLRHRRFPVRHTSGARHSPNVQPPRGRAKTRIQYFLNADFFDPSRLERTTLDGTTVEDVTTLEDISFFALAADSIVLYDTSSKALYSVPKSGGAAALLYKPSESGDVVALAASDRFAYWATSKSVWRVGLDGAGAVALLQTTNSVQLIAVDASGLYGSIDTAGYTPPAYVVKIAEPN